MVRARHPLGQVCSRWPALGGSEAAFHPAGPAECPVVVTPGLLSSVHGAVDPTVAESAGILSSGGGWEKQHPPQPPGAAVCRLLLSTALVSALSPRPLSGHYAHLTDGVWQLTEGHTEVLKLAPARPGAGAVLGSWAHPGCACLSPAAPTACWAAWEPGPRTGTPTPAVLPEQPAIPVLCQYWCYLAENEYPDRDGVFVIVNCPVALCLERERGWSPSLSPQQAVSGGRRFPGGANRQGPCGPPFPCVYSAHWMTQRGEHVPLPVLRCPTFQNTYASQPRGRPFLPS